ncbi:MAG TPA: ATP-binding protein [Candidatus Acidoferrum sp.]|nr:ATP-binding protein [Candidatus Acidoferrum sp.]
MKSSLQIKMVLIMVLLAVSVMLVVGTMLVNNVISFYNDDFLRQVETFFDADMMASLETAAGTGVDAVYDRMSLYASQLGIDTYRNFYILSPDGKLLAGSNEELGGALEMTPNLMAELSGRVGERLNVAARYMDYAVPAAGYVIYIKDTKEEVRDLTWEIVLIIIETMLVTLIIAILLSFLLARTITNPIEKLTGGAVKIAAGDFSEPLPVSSADEIGTLTVTFNAMAEVLKKTLDDVEGERNKFKTIFLYLTDGVAVFDASGTLLHINRAAFDMLGGHWDENVSRFEDVFPSEVVGFAPAELKEGGDASPVLDITSGERRLKAYFAPFELPQQSGSMSEGLIAVLHDVTEQERLNSSRREFIANVSHELRTPLTNIKSYTETVLDSPELEAQTRHSFLQVVLNESDRMIRIVKDLLTLSRLDSDKLDLRPRPFDASAMLQRVHNAMRIDAENHRHTLTLEMGELGEVSGDVERIEQVVVNIVSNSVKYTPDGGRIAIEASRDDKELLIAVTDNGMGISEKDQRRIFERFYRVDKARSREKGGTGLGLAIAKEIVEASGGSITLASRLGEFTRVEVRLPV